MTKPIQYKIFLILCGVIGVLTMTIIWLPRPYFSPCVTTAITETNIDGRIPVVFEHKDTGIQMIFFGTMDNEYYYLKSIHDYNWIWSGTHQEFITQFQRIEPPLARKRTAR